MKGKNLNFQKQKRITTSIEFSRQTLSILMKLRNQLRQHGINTSITDRHSVLNIINIASQIDDNEVKSSRSDIIKYIKDVQHIYLVDEAQENAVCEQCSSLIRLSEIDLSERYIACSCGQVILLIIKNQRSHPRQPVHLTGIYRFEGEDTRIGEVIVEDLSYGGARIRNLSPHSINQNDQLIISFTLDDSYNTIIHKRAIVTNVQNHIFGLKFIEKSHSDHCLATYLGVKWIKH